MSFQNKILQIVGITAVLIYVGCGNRSLDADFAGSDGNSGFIASEVNDMGNAALDQLSAGLGKVLSADQDTYYVDVEINPWHKIEPGIWAREANANFPQGQRNRKDTVYFYNSAGELAEKPTLATVDSVVHNRSVIRARNGNEVEISLHMEIVINKNTGDTTSVKNGSIKGFYNNIQFRSSIIKDVTRKREQGKWNKFPESGSISIDRPLRSIEIEFKGNGQATATVTRKRDSRAVVVNIDVNTGEES
ncbi:MAG: hypothetical protein ABIA63_08090 [bacterium]